MDFEQPVTPEYAAQFLGISPRTLINLTRKIDNPLPHFRVGRYYRFYMSDVVSYFNVPTKPGKTDGASQ